MTAPDPPDRHRFLRDTFLLFALGVFALVCAFADPARGDTVAWCAIPGPHGEAIYCTDEQERLPAILRPRVRRPILLEGLDTYPRGTRVEEVARPHRWGCPVRYRSHLRLGLEAVVPLRGEQPYLRWRAGRREFPLWGACR